MKSKKNWLENLNDLERIGINLLNDYLLWIKYEAEGVQRLNRVVHLFSTDISHFIKI